MDISLPRVDNIIMVLDNHIINGERCATIVLLYISAEKNYDEERKNGKKKCSEFQLASLGCEEQHLNHLASRAKPPKLCYLV